MYHMQTQVNINTAQINISDVWYIAKNSILINTKQK